MKSIASKRFPNQFDLYLGWDVFFLVFPSQLSEFFELADKRIVYIEEKKRQAMKKLRKSLRKEFSPVFFKAFFFLE